MEIHSYQYFLGMSYILIRLLDTLSKPEGKEKVGRLLNKLRGRAVSYCLPYDKIL